MIVLTNGIAMLLMKTIITTFLPTKLYLPIAYPASMVMISTRNTAKNVTITVLMKYVSKCAFSQILVTLSKVGFWGISPSLFLKNSFWSLKEADIIHKNG